MLVPTSDLQSKLTRAIVARLIASGAGTTADTFAAPQYVERPLPNTTVDCNDGEPFDGPGNCQFEVAIELRDNAIVQPADTDPLSSRRSANDRMTKVVNELTLSDDGHTLAYTARAITDAGRAMAVSDGSAAGNTWAEANADMADFTCLWWESLRISPLIPSNQGDYWMRELKFKAVCCSGSFDMDLPSAAELATWRVLEFRADGSWHALGMAESQLVLASSHHRVKPSGPQLKDLVTGLWHTYVLYDGQIKVNPVGEAS